MIVAAAMTQFVKDGVMSARARRIDDATFQEDLSFAERDEKAGITLGLHTKYILDARDDRVELARLRSINDGLEGQISKLTGACVAAFKSVGRFPGSVHDRAMAKIDKALGRRGEFVDPDEAEMDALKARLADTERLVALLTMDIAERAKANVVAMDAVKTERDAANEETKPARR